MLRPRLECGCREGRAMARLADRLRGLSRQMRTATKIALGRWSSYRLQSAETLNPAGKLGIISIPVPSGLIAKI